MGWEFHFALYNRIKIRSLISTKNVSFETEKQNKTSYLIGVKVRVSESNKIIAEIEAKKKARMIMNYISIVSGAYTIAYLHGWNEIRNGVIKGIVGAQLVVGMSKRSKLLDFDLKKKMHALTQYAHAYEHASNALNAFETGNMPNVITELYQIVDSKNLIKLREKYEPLRDVLLHSTPIRKSTELKLNKSFGKGYFVLNRRRVFDNTSVENREKLYMHAILLLKDVLPLLR